MALIGTKDINGQEVEIHAGSSGTWRIRLDDQDIGSGETLDAATAKARNAINKRKVKVEVRFVTPLGERGVATGFHGGTGKVLTRIGDQAAQVERYAKALRDDIPDEKVQAMVSKRAQARRLMADADEIQKEYALNLAQAVEKAIDAKVAEQEAAA